MIRAHKAPVFARLRADSILSTATFDGEVTNRPSRYCSVYMNGGLRDSERLSGPSAFADFRITIHSIGSTVEQCQLVQERVMAQLIDYTPPVAGRNPRRLRHVASVEVEMDTDIDPPLYIARDVFEWTTAPA